MCIDTYVCYVECPTKDIIQALAEQNSQSIYCIGICTYRLSSISTNHNKISIYFRLLRYYLVPTSGIPINIFIVERSLKKRIQTTLNELTINHKQGATKHTKL